MALFKICRGTKENLKNLQLHEGYCYFTTDEQKFYIDYLNSDNELQRLPLNSKASVKIAGRVFENELSEAIMNIPTTRALNDALQEKVIGDLVDDIDTFKKLRDLIKYFGDEDDGHELSNFEKLADILLEEGFEKNTNGKYALKAQLTPRVIKQLLNFHLNNQKVIINEDKSFTIEEIEGNPHETSPATLKKYSEEENKYVDDPLDKVRNCKDEELGVSNALQTKLNGKLDVKEGDIGYIFTKEDDSYIWKKTPAVTNLTFKKFSINDFISL